MQTEFVIDGVGESMREIVGENISEQAILNVDVGPAFTRIRLWDLPTRIFHWSLVAAVSTAVITGELGGSWMGVHAKAGLTIIGLVVFRLIWGVIGSTHSRFINFVPTLKKIRTYLNGQWQGVGHNPLGAISVFALLGLLALQATTGLFSNDDIDFTGPLFNLVNKTLSNRLTGIHHLLANGLLVLMALHIVAIVFYLGVKKDNLVKPMVTGWKEVRSEKSAARGSVAGLIAALLIAVAVVFVASGVLVDDAHNTPAVVAPAASSSPSW